jgi:hypothetical protein
VLDQGGHVHAPVHGGIALELLTGAVEQRGRAGGVVTLVVDPGDGDLDHALPEVAVVVGCGVPDVLEALVRLEQRCSSQRRTPISSASSTVSYSHSSSSSVSSVS